MRARANGLELEYDTFGDPQDAPMVLITGFSMQMIAWDEAFCGQLAARGFHVVRFDNRDIGLSTKIDSMPPPNLDAIFGGDTSSVPYHIPDMADDAAGLLDALGLDSAHIVGVSMGGMIAQTLAIRHPRRVRSLASIMSTTGDRAVGQATPEAVGVLMQPPPKDREAFIEQGVSAWRMLSSTVFPFDEVGMRALVARGYDRSFSPRGIQRQLAAILGQPDRSPQLRQLRVPTVVIHGAADPLINVSGGEATARAIPGAKLVIVPGMGHNLPEGAWPIIVGAIVDNAKRQV
jgi:pimeloyl-ACP methyl ester carboxylesterase